MSKPMKRMGKKPTVKSLYNKQSDAYVPNWDEKPGMQQHNDQFQHLLKDGQVRVPKGAKGIGPV